ncbi:site-specific DNA-methyltransferase [Deinococcus wulumuqiensis]|uniref:site-specific DNA-methyltransferase n=1 Tax=Deinococcus wulumuqiensis TaxID=980427 RepID=UPI00242AD576|nr:site-specific DNA-methyltransferase [Deinococcus wulumuqiensis]
MTRKTRLAASQDKQIEVSAYRHKEGRVNIPTSELRNFVSEDQLRAPDVVFARDASLDPQLVWRGKYATGTEQDALLRIPNPPLYEQERIDPRMIIEDIKRLNREKKNQENNQPSLFEQPEEHLSLDQQLEFYQHEQPWRNRLILGDSLQVMNSLAEREGLKGKVQCIYFDPPYGIKFGSNWQVSTKKRDVKDGKDFVAQPEQVRAFRDTWDLGIHSYLGYLRDRLMLARELLAESGSIFVQISDENLHLIRNILDEVFGSDNYAGTISFAKSSGLGAVLLPRTNDYIVWYSKNIEDIKYRQIFSEKGLTEGLAGAYTQVLNKDGSVRRLTASEKRGDQAIGNGDRVFRYGDLTKPGPGQKYDVVHQNRKFNSGSRWWGMPPESMQRSIKAGRVAVQGNTLSYVRFLQDFPASPINNVWTDTGVGSGMDKLYVVQTDTKVIERCILMTTDPGDLVLDPTCGSGTTAYVAEQWGRRWITTDTSRVALSLARMRLMGAKYPYYLLADSKEGAKKEAEINGLTPSATLPNGLDLRKGFVYERARRITLKSIANNDEIDVIYDDFQTRLEPLRAELNVALGQKWEDWEIPREAEKDWPQSAKDLHAKWWQLRRERQAKIDASIERNADTEYLYDKPYEDKAKVRVAGPFTVESLTPHRLLPVEGELPRSEKVAEDDAELHFVEDILENLQKAGVQNSKADQRLTFEHMDTYPGEWIQAVGTFTDEGGKTRRAAISVGPRYGTVTPQQITEAAKETVNDVKADLLVVCGFAFDAAVPEEARRFGTLTVLTARMNADLMMADDLKKTSAANLFTVFGEPDLLVEVENGELTVEVRGLDIYNPIKGVVESEDADEMACWFVDTDYNGETFMVRQAYFIGNQQPYEKLKKALRAEVDEALWEQLYATKSIPFALPTSGKFAVKVVNHYGDEALRVFEVKKLAGVGA